MSSLRTITPEVPLAALLGAAGAAKVAGADFTKQNFARWGYGDGWRPAIGALEVATAGAAVVGLANAPVRRAAAITAVATMGGAIATHISSGDAKYNLVPPLLVTGLAVASLFDLTAKSQPLE